MVKHSSPILIFISLQLLLLLLATTTQAQLLPIVDSHGSEVYIIDVERHTKQERLSDGDLKAWHLSFLPNSTLDSGASRLVYSYRHVLSGFAARLTLDELQTVKAKPGFIHAHKEHRHPLLTTYTPRYLGLTSSKVWGSTMMGEKLIIGVLDTGIKPGHPSFKDTNMPPKPPRSMWKGNCTHRGFCNNKVIGAMAFFGGTNPSPTDTEGHGTHVATIAAGNFVAGASVNGMAKGEASGMAPMAYLSIYKVCFPLYGCSDSDILAAINKAIDDGVHVLSMSIGAIFNATFFDNPISRGSFAAIKHNIVPVASAGNYGANPGDLCHNAPWVISVGASSTDRKIVSVVELPYGKQFIGESSYQPKTWDPNIQWQLEFPGINGDLNATCCTSSALANLNLQDKIVICENCIAGDRERSEAAFKAGARGMILLNQIYEGRLTTPSPFVLPASNVDYLAREEILDYYVSSLPNKTFASIRFNGTQFGFMPSPSVPSFSSRGPSFINGGIVKPDVLAPGVNILAAWHEDVSPNPSALATHTFSFESGTSMAAPHVSGVVAMVRKKHRGWTPAEILSAIVTTANDSWASGGLLIDESTRDEAGIYASGAGVVNPANAMDPGLLFGLSLDHYLGFMCGLGYTDDEVSLTMGEKRNCSGAKRLTATELNYPSITVNLTRVVTSQRASRTAKNVGNAREEYWAAITEPVGVEVTLSTYALKFTRVNQELTYDISFRMKGTYPARGTQMIRRGKIVWQSGSHVVTTPIAVRFV